jgi:hypothetical protein
MVRWPLGNTVANFEDRTRRYGHMLAVRPQTNVERQVVSFMSTSDLAFQASSEPVEVPHKLRSLLRYWGEHINEPLDAPCETIQTCLRQWTPPMSPCSSEIRTLSPSDFKSDELKSVVYDIVRIIVSFWVVG